MSGFFDFVSQVAALERKENGPSCKELVCEWDNHCIGTRSGRCNTNQHGITLTSNKKAEANTVKSNEKYSTDKSTYPIT